MACHGQLGVDKINVEDVVVVVGEVLEARWKMQTPRRSSLILIQAQPKPPSSPDPPSSSQRHSSSADIGCHWNS